MRLQEKLKEMQRQGKALLAVNFYNYETLRGVCEAFADKNYPLIMQLSPGSIKYLGLEVAVKLARAASEQFGLQSWLHLDHAQNVDLIRRCLDDGFDSVMIDTSEEPFAENVRVTGEVVRMAEKYQANVEAELGFVPKLGQVEKKDGFTCPKEAASFVKETGVNALAVAIGSAHGFYKSEPKLDLQRLSEISESTDACLVLHGGSGIPAEAIREAVKRGICKINLATEVKNAFMKSVVREVNSSKEIDLRIVFPPAIQSVRDLVMGKLDIIGQ
jgi:fructose-bisphosphate aldolase class II/tagatose 1,6-diphosphate aldolase GatY/KbaY